MVAKKADLRGQTMVDLVKEAVCCFGYGWHVHSPPRILVDARNKLNSCEKLGGHGSEEFNGPRGSCRLVSTTLNDRLTPAPSLPD